MRCTIGEIDMMEVPLPVHEPAADPGYTHPNHTADEDDTAPPSPSPSPGFNPWGLGPLFQQGFVDCAQEALRFLMEEEGLAADDPLVMGLKQHLLLNAVPPHQGNNSAAAAFSLSGPNPRMVSGKQQQQQQAHNEMVHVPPVSSQNADVTELSPVVSSSVGGFQMSEGDLAGVLSCLTYVHPDPARAAQDHHQHSCHQMELLPARARELSFTSSESDADSSLNVSSVTSVSDCGETAAAVSGDDMAVTDSVFDSSDNADSISCVSQTRVVTDLTNASTSQQTVVQNSEMVPDCTLTHSQSATSAPTTATTTTTTAMETAPTSVVVAQDSTVSSLSLLAPLMSVGGAGLTPEEVRIRTLAHEILALLQEEALDEDSDVEDDDVTDDVLDMESEDMMIEIEQ